jgi:hypothetical protein
MDAAVTNWTPPRISRHSSKVCAILNSQTLFELLTLLARSFTKDLSTLTKHQNMGHPRGAGF